MPFDGEPRGALAMQMIDWLKEYFDEGKHWLQGGFHQADGRRCLVSALAHLRAVRHVKGDDTGLYIRFAIREWGFSVISDRVMREDRRRAHGLAGFNDSCAFYWDLEYTLTLARHLAELEASGQRSWTPKPRPGSSDTQ